MGFLIKRANYVIFITAYLVLFLLTFQNPLFWDTIQFGGHHPNWYYHHQFRYFLLPDYCDSGHPPAFGMYIAGCWLLLGKSLAVTHLAMLPFILLIVVQAVRLGAYLFPADRWKAFFLTAILLSEAVLLTQCSLVSPDICVIAFFLTALNAILNKRGGVLVLMVLLMGLMSMRAMMCAVALFVYSVICHWQTRDGSMVRYIWRQMLPFIPGGIIALAYLVYHYKVKGWTGYHAGSPWADAFESVGLRGFVKNNIVLGWRLLDIGKIGTFIAFAVLVIAYLRGKLVIAKPNRINHFLGLVVALFLLTALPLTLYSNLLMHRYIIPLYLAIGVCTFLLLLSASIKGKYFIATILIIIQLSGHFWSYPPPLSQGWDATLAHMPYYQLRADFKAYMQQQQIRPEEVATAFPMAAADSFIDLRGSAVPYKDFRTDTTEYVWYSNVCNAMLKNAPDYFNQWELIKYSKLGYVEMGLFKRKN